MGNTLQRLAAKCVSRKVAHSLGCAMAPLQLGCGTPLGCEAAAHAARIYIQNLPLSHVMLKLDFQNAFNTLRRDKMLEAVRESAPSLYPFIHSAYEKPSTLFCGDCTIQSSEGVQQGDPLGPFLFCLTIHPMVMSVQSEFRIFYMDDGTLGGHVDEVLRDLKLIEVEAAKLGLVLNRHKSELICEDPSTRDEMLEEAPGLQFVSHEKAELLGAPIGGNQATDKIIQGKIDRLRIMGERLGRLQTQDALLLLQLSFAIPKVMYVLRSSPCCISPQLISFDGLLRNILSEVINICLDDDLAWAQASLPVRLGGIGIRSTAQLAPTAFLASAAGCAELVRKTLPPRLQCLSDPSIKVAMESWREGHEHPPPSPSTSHQQKAWDTPRVEATYRALLDSATDSHTRARLLAVKCKETGAWLGALPVASLSLRMDNETVRIAVGLRLGLPLCRPHQCVHCGSQVDKLGTHGLSCRYSKGRHPRHAEVNNVIKRSLDAAQVPSRLEPTGLH